MSLMRSALLLTCLSIPAFGAASSEAPSFYDASYRAQLVPEKGVIEVQIMLSGERLPSRIVLHADARRYRSFRSTDALQIAERQVTWQPRGKQSRLRYEFVVNHERAPRRYDSYASESWALFRGDRMVPRASVTAKRGLQSRATLEFVLPQDWSVITAYAPDAEHRYVIDDPRRRFDRPTGWMLAGKIGTRGEQIGPVHAIVAAPSGNSARRQDMLAFLNWNLPRLTEVIENFPRRVLIVSAGDPMWRGGLSGPASIYIHADRPLISENRTSTLLHELVHVGLGVRADHESDWIVEGLAEYYSLETLRRSGSISERRHQEALASLASWAKRAPSLFVSSSSGPVTARAVLVLRAVDDEIRQRTHGQAGLDDLMRKLSAQRGELSLERFALLAAQVAGAPLRTLQRAELTKPFAEPER